MKGKFGLPEVLEFPSSIFTKSGSMTDTLFCEYIENCILRLYPNISPEYKLDEKGNIISGPVLINTDTGTGRLCTNFANVECREELEKLECHIILTIPNATSISAEIGALQGLHKGRF